MSVQLILHPQNVQGFTNDITYQYSNFLVNGNLFQGLNASPIHAEPNCPNAIVSAITNAPPNVPNQWYRFISTCPPAATVYPQNISNNLVFDVAVFGSLSGIYQRLTNLTIGQTYEIKIEFAGFGSNDQNYIFGVLESNLQTSISGFFDGPGVVYTMNFTASSVNDDIFYFTCNGEVDTYTVNKISINGVSGSSTTLIGDGQVICDLYEDEDLPLTLSVDEFKNVAEKVQSYSKAFKLPSTKRNNRIFDALFEITREYDGISFNPYQRTQCVLKQDGFILFQGFLRLIEVLEKDGEISYNVNLYSEVTALADVLSDRKFRELDFTELTHDYNITNIKNSWNDNGTGITYTEPADSGFRNANNTVKYPFVDWNHSLTLDAANFPVMPNLESAYRPWINIKYLIDRIFNASSTPFTYTSNFFNSSEFSRLYMDFNWGQDVNPNDSQQTGFAAYFSSDLPLVYATTNFEPIQFSQNNFPITAGYDSGLDIFVVPANQTNQTYNLSIQARFWALKDATLESKIVQVKNGITTDIPYANVNLQGSAQLTWDDNGNFNSVMNVQVLNGGYYPGGPPTIELDSWQGNNASFTAVMLGDTIDSVTIDSIGTSYQFWDDFVINGVTQSQCRTLNWINETFTDLNPGDTLQVVFKSNINDAIIQDTYPSDLNLNQVNGRMDITVSTSGVTSDTLLQTLRGELGQWEFLKGIFTMFNLVTVPDEDNPNNIKIEPYADIFLNSSDSVELNWTDKVDVSEMKLTPLTDLNKKTIFKYAEDDSDFNFRNYNKAVGQSYLYGSKEHEVTNIFNILNGEDEVEAAPFASTVIKPYMTQFGDLETPAIYDFNLEDGTSTGFDNLPRILYNVGVKSLTSCTYKIPDQNDVLGIDAETDFLQFSHTRSIPVTATDTDLNFGVQQLLIPGSTPQTLYGLYWSPYYNELYNPNTRIMTIKVNLSASDINTFKFNDTVYIKNRTFRVNKIDYKPNDLATVEFILIT